jgi:hypothetical protein
MLALAASCGGDGIGSGGTGAPVSHASGTGTVTGFGSLVLDGLSYDDREAAVVAEVAPGASANAGVSLGDSVEVEFSSEGAISTIVVDPRLLGPVDAFVADGFSALGHEVRVNVDANAGPVTQFEPPLAGLASLAAGDVVAVHGIVRGGNGDERIQATRIERLDAAPAEGRIVGRLRNLRATGTSRNFTLGALDVDFGGAALAPAGVTLADGQSVRVFGNSAPGVPARFVATLVRVYQRTSEGGLEGQVGGVVDDLDAGTFSVNGVRVEVGGALVTPASRTLADGAYVQVRGTFRSADGVLQASRIKIRNRADEPEVELAGNAFEVDAAARTASVRGTRVSTAAARLQGCAGGLVEGRYVEVSGALAPAGVVADSVRCRAEPDGAIVERRGTAGPVDTRSRTFTLSSAIGGAPVTVRFDDRTFFGGVDPGAFSGVGVRVEGTFSRGALLARAVNAL